MTTEISQETLSICAPPHTKSNYTPEQRTDRPSHNLLKRAALGLAVKSPRIFSLVLRSLLQREIPAKALQSQKKVSLAELQVLTNDVENLRRTSKLSPVHRAALQGDLEELKKLFAEEAPSKRRKFLEKTDSRGMTALHYAALGGQKEVIEWLLKNGVSKDQQTSNDMTALHFAMLREDLAPANVLISGGANPLLETAVGSPVALLKAKMEENQPKVSNKVKAAAAYAVFNGMGNRAAPPNPPPTQPTCDRSEYLTHFFNDPPTPNSPPQAPSVIPQVLSNQPLSSATALVQKLPGSAADITTLIPAEPPPFDLLTSPSTALDLISGTEHTKINQISTTDVTPSGFVSEAPNSAKTSSAVDSPVADEPIEAGMESLAPPLNLSPPSEDNQETISDPLTPTDDESGSAEDFEAAKKESEVVKGESEAAIGLIQKALKTPIK
ncbi:MAG: ankyrin repeat domain-containing protein [Chlamydiae bacterium]|nr:ankyrin repeat domain-containing protein [Chlamydiota bacterium]